MCGVKETEWPRQANGSRIENCEPQRMKPKKQTGNYEKEEKKRQ